MRIRPVLVACLLASCGGAARAPIASPPAPTTPAESPPAAAFRAYVARRLGVTPSQLVDESQHLRDNHNHGAASAIVMRVDGTSAEVRGWVTTDRMVITPKQHLGVLLAEAGVWQHPSDLAKLAYTLAQDLVWVYGDGAKVDSSPVLTIASDGSGTLVFDTLSSLGLDPEPVQDLSTSGMGGGPGQQTYRDTVTFTAGHKATLQRERLLTGPPPI